MQTRPNTAETAVPDPFAPSMREDLIAWDNPLYGGQAFDVWTCPTPDARVIPTEPPAPADDLKPAFSGPVRLHRRSMLEETRFLKLTGVNAAFPVFEVLRVYYSRPGYLTRLATFLEITGQANANAAYISNDLSDPDPFPVTFNWQFGTGTVSVRWHLRLDDECSQAAPPFLVAAPAAFLPTCHRVDNLPAQWEDMRYHWGQRPQNKIARVDKPAFIRLFVELLGDTGLATWRVGGLLSGHEGTK